MRLQCLESGHRLKHKIMLGMMRVVMGGSPPDVVKTLMYRPEFFGKKFGAVTHRSIQQSEHWKVAECELFAAFVSRQNQCPF